MYSDGKYDAAQHGYFLRALRLKSFCSSRTRAGDLNRKGRKGRKGPQSVLDQIKDTKNAFDIVILCDLCGNPLRPLRLKSFCSSKTKARDLTAKDAKSAKARRQWLDQIKDATRARMPLTSASSVVYSVIRDFRFPSPPSPSCAQHVGGGVLR
jgi:hypothetical protein